MISYIHIDTLELFGCHVSQILAVYNEVFSAPPRNEKINLSEIKESLLKILNSKGVIVVAVNNEKIIGFATSIHTSLHKDAKAMGIHEGWFHSDTAILLSFRGRGVASELFNQRESIMSKLAYSPVRYSRTRTDAGTINIILSKYGFKKIKTLTIQTNGVTSSKYIWEKDVSHDSI